MCRKDRLFPFQLDRFLLVTWGSLALFSGTALAQEPVSSTRLVEVQGHAVRVLTIGLMDRLPGQPAIVFQNGASNSLEGWMGILPEVAEMGPIVAYDRPGLGESEAGELLPTPQRMVEHLHDLLGVLGVAPPFILVGHSWGGPLILHYAGWYPEEVAGMVHVDPSYASEEGRVLWASQILPSPDVAGYHENKEEFLAQFPPGPGAELEAILEHLQEDAGTAAVPDRPEIPTTILLAAKPWSLPGSGYETGEAYIEGFLRPRIETLSDVVLGLPRANLVIATEAGHFIQLDDPTLVVEAIRRVGGWAIQPSTTSQDPPFPPSGPEGRPQGRR